MAVGADPRLPVEPGRQLRDRRDGRVRGRAPGPHGPRLGRAVLAGVRRLPRGRRGGRRRDRAARRPPPVHRAAGHPARRDDRRRAGAAVRRRRSCPTPRTCCPTRPRSRRHVGDRRRARAQRAPDGADRDPAARRSRSACSCPAPGTGSPSGPRPRTPTPRRLASISIKRMSTLVWVLAGALATLATIVSAPLTTTSADAAVHDRPRACCSGRSPPRSSARMSSLPIAMVAGVAIGVAESVLVFNNDERGLLDAALFVVVLVALLVLARSRRGGRLERGVVAVAAGAPDPGLAGAGVLGAAAAAARRPGHGARRARSPSCCSTRRREQFLWSRVRALRDGRRLADGAHRLGRPALARPVRVRRARRDDHRRARPRGRRASCPPSRSPRSSGPPPRSSIGTPALRRPGLFLTVSTLAFAVDDVVVAAVPRRVRARRRGTGAACRARSSAACRWRRRAPTTSSAWSCWWWCSSASSWLRRSSLGRAMIAVRDNERAAASFGISPARVKLTAFGIGGGIAGLGRRSAGWAAGHVRTGPVLRHRIAPGDLDRGDRRPDVGRRHGAGRGVGGRAARPVRRQHRDRPADQRSRAADPRPLLPGGPRAGAVRGPGRAAGPRRRLGGPARTPTRHLARRSCRPRPRGPSHRSPRGSRRSYGCGASPSASPAGWWSTRWTSRCGRARSWGSSGPTAPASRR